MELIEIPFVKLALFLLSRLSFHYLKSIKKTPVALVLLSNQINQILLKEVVTKVDIVAIKTNV